MITDAGFVCYYIFFVCLFIQRTYNFQMEYSSYNLHQVLRINEVFSIHYFEYLKDFSYPGETHDFWEFVFVDKGSIEVTAGEKQLNLIKGDIVFHKPNEFHNLKSNGRVAPNLIVMSFSCSDPIIDWFGGKVLRISNRGQDFLAQILHEARNAFSSDLSDPWLACLKKRKDQVFASEQLIKIYLENFLINLIRRDRHIIDLQEPVSPLREKTDKDAFNHTVAYIENNLIDMSDLKTICRSTGYSCTYLEHVFKNKTGRSVMEFYKLAKLERAKELIREGDYTFTQIASVLNYSSVYYFSRVFKKYLGMTPTEYSSSVKLRSP